MALLTYEYIQPVFIVRENWLNNCEKGNVSLRFQNGISLIKEGSLENFYLNHNNI